jgi:molybdate transport system substrate-binding protein
MEFVISRGAVQKTTVRNLLGSRLVLVAPATRPIALKIAPGFALAAALGNGRLAIAHPDSVPAGRYAKAALTSLGVWNSVSDHLARADNVRSALALVARGEAPLGIVYSTDAQAEPTVRVVDVFPARSHPPIVYPAALVAGARTPAASSLFRYLASNDARAIWQKHGFTMAE